MKTSNADVEKAVGVITDHIADLTRCIGVLAAYPEMKPVASEFEKATKELAPVAQALRDQEAEIARLRDRLREEESNATELAKRLTRQREMDENSMALLWFLLDRFGSYMDESDKRAITSHLGGKHD